MSDALSYDEATLFLPRTMLQLLPTLSPLLLLFVCLWRMIVDVCCGCRSVVGGGWIATSNLAFPHTQ